MDLNEKLRDLFKAQLDQDLIEFFEKDPDSDDAALCMLLQLLRNQAETVELLSNVDHHLESMRINGIGTYEKP